MIDDSLRPRIRTTLTAPTASATPITSSMPSDQLTTGFVGREHERRRRRRTASSARRPTRRTPCTISALVWPIAASASGIVAIEQAVEVELDVNDDSWLLVYSAEQEDQHASSPRSAATARAARRRTVLATRRRLGGRLAVIVAPVGRRAADDRRDDAALAELGLAGSRRRSRPRDITTTRSQSPDSSIGSLDLTSTAAPSSALAAQRLVDVEAGADVDALRRLVGEDHVEVAACRNGRISATFCWLPPDRYCAGCSIDAALSRSRRDEVVDRRPLARAADEAEPGVPLEHLERGVGAHAEGGEDRLLLAVRR